MSERVKGEAVSGYGRLGVIRCWEGRVTGDGMKANLKYETVKEKINALTIFTWH